MKKRLAAVLAMAFALVGVLSGPAQAAHHGENIVTRQYQSSAAKKTLSVMNNTHDVFFGSKVEALLDIYRPPERDTPVKMLLDRVWLEKCDTAAGGGCESVRSVEPGWVCPPEFSAIGDESFQHCGTTPHSWYESTGWYDTCVGGNGYFRSKANYKIKWVSISGDPLSALYVIVSDVTWENCVG